jgi:lipoprotein-anchoring transpeptidase ErfK/SrfK
MRIATRPFIVVAAIAVLVACGVSLLYGPAAPAQTGYAVAAPQYGAPYTLPPLPDLAPEVAEAPPAPPPPPPVPAIGSDRGFDSVSNIWLRPGRYVWRPDRAEGGPVGVVVDLGRQMAYVYRAGTLIGVTTVSTGRRHYETPVGSFPILQKAVWHRSTLYSGAPMPYMQRLTWGGVALHSGGVPGYRQSHGCIHLPPAFARSLYNVTRIGSEVRIVRAFDEVPQAVGPPMTIAARAPFPTTAQSAAVIIAAAL